LYQGLQGKGYRAENKAFRGRAMPAFRRGAMRGEAENSGDYGHASGGWPSPKRPSLMSRSRHSRFAIPYMFPFRPNVGNLVYIATGSASIGITDNWP